MSQFIGRFTLSNNVMTSVATPTTGLSAIVISNDSQFSLSASLNGTSIMKSIPAGVADVLIVPDNSFNGTVLLFPTAQLMIQNSPANIAEVTVYGRGESVPGIYPISLNRLSNTGNNVGMQNILRSTSSNAMNNANLVIGGSGQLVIYLWGLSITGSHATAQAKGIFHVTGFASGIDLQYALAVETATAMPPIIERFASPLPGSPGGAVTAQGPTLSDATIACNLVYYQI